jgi:cytochrome c
MAADPFQPMSMPLVISAIVAVVLMASHAGIALAIVRGVAGDDGDARGVGKRFFLRVALVLSALCLALVPATAWTLAPAGLTTRTLLAIGLAELCLLVSIAFMWVELAAPRTGSPRTRHALGAFGLFCVSLVVAKIVHQDETRQAFLVANPPKPAPVVVAAPPAPPAPPVAPAAPVVAETDPVLIKGEKVFKTTCIICHALDKRLVGPPIQEIAALYKDNAAGIAAWAKAPGKKRPDYPPMIAVPLPDEDLKAAGAYMLKIGAK